MGKKIIIISVAIAVVLAASIALFRIFKTSNDVSFFKDGEVRAMMKLAAENEGKGELFKARDAYQRAIDKFPDSKYVEQMQSSLDNLNVKILFSPTITPDSVSYEVVQGDSLAKIAKRFGTTMELIMKSNNMKGTSVMLGKKLKISKARFSIIVDKSQNILTLKADGNIFKTYHVSTGKNNSTPTGNFKITTKLENPTWYTAGAVVPPGSPDNILGTRWLGISAKSYGIHGTTDPGSIGKQSTAGCVRMLNNEVEELYAIVPEGTDVVIID